MQKKLIFDDDFENGGFGSKEVPAPLPVPVDKSESRVAVDKSESSESGETKTAHTQDTIPGASLPVDEKEKKDDQEAEDNQQTGKEEKDAGVVRVTINEAARLFGVSMQTIRRAIADNELTYIVVGGRYKINFESLVKWSQEKTTIRNKLLTRGIGQFVDRWRIKNTLYSPRSPRAGTPRVGGKKK